MQTLSTRPCENNYENCDCNGRYACLQIFQSTHSVTEATQLLGGCSLETTCVQVRAPEALSTFLGEQYTFLKNLLLFYTKYGKG